MVCHVFYSAHRSLVEFDLFICHSLHAFYDLGFVWYPFTICYFGIAARRAIAWDFLYFCFRPLILYVP